MVSNLQSSQPQATTVGKMSHSFTTDLIPASDRREAWLLNAKQICGDCRFHFPKCFPFHGSIQRRTVAELEMTLFSSSALSFNKYPSVSLNSESRSWIVITQLAGLRSYNQDGKTAVLNKGDATLIDSAKPWSSNCPGDCARLYLRVPRRLLQLKVHSDEIPVARRIPGESGLGNLLFQLCTSLYRQAAQLTQEKGAAAIESYLGILAACVGNTNRLPLVSSHRTELSSRISNYIDAHLNETTLSPGEIAKALNISVRHVHRIFSRQDSTVGELIREQRLRRCRIDLADPSLRAKSITEIAFFWGFNDSAHFSRVFKQQFGENPRTFRLRANSGLQTMVDERTERMFLKLTEDYGLRTN